MRVVVVLVMWIVIVIVMAIIALILVYPKVCLYFSPPTRNEVTLSHFILRDSISNFEFRTPGWRGALTRKTNADPSSQVTRELRIG